MIYWPASWAPAVQLDKGKYIEMESITAPTLEEANPSVRVDRFTLILIESLCLVTCLTTATVCESGGGECVLCIVCVSDIFCVLQPWQMRVGVFFCSTSECLQGSVGGHSVVGKIKRFSAEISPFLSNGSPVGIIYYHIQYR